MLALLFIFIYDSDSKGYDEFTKTDIYSPGLDNDNCCKGRYRKARIVEGNNAD